MLSPFMTVLILAVLWLIVVVPMVVRRNDERRRERSVADWGRSMRALGRRADTTAGRTDVFVPRPSRAEPAMSGSAASGSGMSGSAISAAAAPARRPVPAAQEALMYPPDRSELSEARTEMLARRRRSLLILTGGSVLFVLLGLVVGGLLWLLAVLFLAGLGGYTLFLRNQALHDRSRRENRQVRAASRRPAGYDATSELGRFDDIPDSVVRIDDDDIDLHSMDTIDLTGLYSEEAATEAVQRRAS